MKNRTVIGIICIILAVAVTFFVSPMINKVSDKKTTVVRFVNDVPHGTQIKESDIETVKVSASSLPSKCIKEKSDIVGKYASADLFGGDFATEPKVTDKANSASDIMASLKGDKVVMSVTINSFAGGLSGKIENGDVVSICVTDKNGDTQIPAALKYVKVITTTTAGGIDENEVVENDDGNFELPTTITVLVSVEQAKMLANFEKNADMHVALVYRGDDASAERFLKAQDEYLKKHEKGEGN